MGNWIPGVSGLSPGEVADAAGSAVDGATPDGAVLPSTAEDVYQLTPMSAVTNAGNELVEGDVVDAGDDLLFNVPSFSAGVVSGDRENAVLTGLPREAYDWVADYEGTWGGMADQHDITGPSFRPSGNWFGYNSGDAQDDPTRPANWGAAVWALVAAVVLAVVAYLLRPLFSLLAGLVGGGE